MKIIRFVILIAIVVAVVWIGPQLVAYLQTRDAIPAGVTMGNASIGGATPADAVANLRQAFESPVLVYHGDRRLVLRPQDIGFAVDAEGMVEEARRYGRGLYAVQSFLFHLVDRPPIGANVPLRYTYDRAKLGAWLQAQADAYDNEPTPAYAKLDTLQFVPGQPGRYTDLNSSAIDIMRAFTTPYNRQARLALVERPPLPPDFPALETALRQRLERYGGIYSLYFQHLPTGEEIEVDADTAFAGMSTVKIPILLKLYHDYELPLEPRMSAWISDTVKSETASNAAANALLYHIGGEDTLTGARRVTEFVRDLGLQNTFIAVPYDSDLKPPPIQTPANTNPEYNTSPDPAMQTTPRDVGFLLAETARCAEGGGTLIAAYPDRITARRMRGVDWLVGTEPHGLSPQIRRARRHTRGAQAWVRVRHPGRCRPHLRARRPLRPGRLRLPVRLGGVGAQQSPHERPQPPGLELLPLSPGPGATAAVRPCGGAESSPAPVVIDSHDIQRCCLVRCP